MKPHTQNNLEAFNAFLAEKFEELFKTPAFAIAAQKTTPSAHARKITLALAASNAQASKDGPAVQAALKQFGILNSYKAIREFLNGD